MGNNGRLLEKWEECGREIIVGGRRIVEGTGNFRKEWITVGKPGNCGKEDKTQFSEILHCYGIAAQLFFSP